MQLPIEMTKGFMEMSESFAHLGKLRVLAWIRATKRLQEFYGSDRLSFSSVWGINPERVPFRVLGQIADKEGIFAGGEEMKRRANEAAARRFARFYYEELANLAVTGGGAT